MSCTRTGSRCRLWLSRRASETTMQALTFTGGAKKAPGWSLSANFLVAHQQPKKSFKPLFLNKYSHCTSPNDTQNDSLRSWLEG